MFPQFKKLKNKSGVVLFIVLMTVMVIIIFTLGMLTQSANETNYAQQQVDQIAAQELSKGLFWNAYSSGTMSNGAVYSLSGRNYTITMTNSLNTTSGLFGWEVDANYDTF